MDMMPRPARWNAELVCGADFVTKWTLFVPSGAKPSKSALYMGVSSYLAGFDIRSIKTHQETSDELSSSSEGDDIALQAYLTGCDLVYTVPPKGGCENIKTSPVHGCKVNLVSLDIRSIDTHHEASSELSRSSEGDDVAFQTILPVHKRHSTPRWARNH